MLYIEFGGIRVTGIRPGRVAGRGERHVPHTDRVERPQNTKGTAQRMPTLDARQRAELLALVRFEDICDRRMEWEENGRDGKAAQIQ